MHSGEEVDSRGGSVTKLLIVCLISSEEEVRRIVEAQAGSGTLEQQGITTLGIKESFRRYRDENSRRINRVAPPGAGARIIILGNIEHREHFGAGDDIRAAYQCSDLLTFRKKLPGLLSQGSLDLRSSSSRKLAAYMHGTVDDRRVATWLGQFTRFGLPWVGEGLLRALDFWPPDRVRRSLALLREELANFDCICVNRKRVGKSADVLANLVKKEIGGMGLALPVHDFEEALTGSTGIPACQRILFVEDSLLTFTEHGNFLCDLLGEPHLSGRPDHRPEHTARVDRGLLASKQIQLRFPVSTSLGTLRLSRFIAEHKLRNMSFVCSPQGRIEVLSDLGKAAVQNQTFFRTEPGMKDCPADPEKHLLPVVFQRGWGNEERKRRAMSFCAHLGAQLFGMYLEQAHKPFPAEKRKVCCFGMLGLGLALAFGHSVPKASLPLFWMGGRVTWQGITLDWTPLFPNAAM